MQSQTLALLREELQEPELRANCDRLHLHAITETVSGIAERPASRRWLITLGLVVGIALILIASLTHVVGRGIGVWGNDQNVAWAWDIAGFVFWIGIGHAGTLISAVLLLFRQHWRTSVSRAAEATTLIAVVTAAVYPLFHMGRVWLAYWLFPFPNQMQVWPNFKSPLVWDVFAVTSYFITSALFWYLGLLPDLATLRDRAAPGLRRRLLERLSLGWTGSQRHYVHYEKAYLLLAGLATPLVISVHTVVSFDFAVSVVPGWHSTLFPPYFVAGAVFSGSAMLVALMIFTRSALKLHEFITLRHLDAMNKIVLVTGTMLAYCYGTELYVALESADVYERASILGRFSGPYAALCWLMLGCNVLLPQLYWFRRVRTNVPAMLFISVGINVGMWLERFVIIVISQHRSFLPSTWSEFHPTLFDVSTFLGSLGLFLTLFVLFVRFVPVLSMNEVKALSAEVETLSLDGQPVSAQKAMSEPRTSVLRFKGKVGTAGPYSRLSSHDRRVTVLGWYSGPDQLTAAVNRFAEVPEVTFDVHAPYNLSSVSNVFGGKRSPIAYVALATGALGGIVAYLGQWWAETVGYALTLGGKPSGAWQAYVPITFEVTILAAAFGCFFGFLYFCGLPQWRRVGLNANKSGRATDNLFCLEVQTTEERRADVVRMLHGCGSAHEIEAAE